MLNRAGANSRQGFPEAVFRLELLFYTLAKSQYIYSRGCLTEWCGRNPLCISVSLSFKTSTNYLQSQSARLSTLGSTDDLNSLCGNIPVQRITLMPGAKVLLGKVSGATIAGPVFVDVSLSTLRYRG